jgi:hypothetical protein
MASFASLGAAQEQRLVRANTAAFLKSRLEAFVEAGVLSKTALTALAVAAPASTNAWSAGVPTTFTTRRPEWAYKHVKSAVPGEFWGGGREGKGVGGLAEAERGRREERARRRGRRCPPPLQRFSSNPSLTTVPPHIPPHTHPYARASQSLARTRPPSTPGS